MKTLLVDIGLLTPGAALLFLLVYGVELILRVKSPNAEIVSLLVTGGCAFVALVVLLVVQGGARRAR